MHPVQLCVIFPSAPANIEIEDRHLTWEAKIEVSRAFSPINSTNAARAIRATNTGDRCRKPEARGRTSEKFGCKELQIKFPQPAQLTRNASGMHVNISEMLSTPNIC